MSVTVKLKTLVGDLQTFRDLCQTYDIELIDGGIGFQDNFRGESVKVVLKDRLNTSGCRDRAYLVNADKGKYALMIDNDPHYCSITKRVGKNGGVLMRDYAEAMSKKKMAGKGMMTSRVVNADNSITLRYAIR